MEFFTKECIHIKIHMPVQLLYSMVNVQIVSPFILKLIFNYSICNMLIKGFQAKLFTLFSDILMFDNSYSWLQQKEIFCRAVVIRPTGEKIPVLQ